MRLKDAKEKYNISSTYYYKLKAKSNGDEKEFIKLLEEYVARKEAKQTKKTEDKK